MITRDYFVHPSAFIDEPCEIGAGTKIWHLCHIMPHSRIGRSCILGTGVYIDTGVSIGDNVKIQNYVSVFHGVVIDDGVFVGPHVCFTNDRQPRAVNPDGALKGVADWVVSPTLVQRGASIGANATIMCGITIGEWAMIGAGSVVTRDVPRHSLVYGNPARLHGYACSCGVQLSVDVDAHAGFCPKCQTTVLLKTLSVNS